MSLSLLLVCCLWTIVLANPMPTNDLSVECAACQVAAHVFRKDKSVEGEAHLVSQKAVSKYCGTLDGCAQSFSHCQVLTRLSRVSIPLNSSSETTTHPLKLVTDLQKSLKHCETDEKMAVLSGQPGIAECALCHLVYTFFKYINYNILENPLLGYFKSALVLACTVAEGKLQEQPAVCVALLGSDALPAIIRGIQDSLGSFYDIIAVQGLNCPNLQLLFTRCP